MPRELICRLRPKPCWWPTATPAWPAAPNHTANRRAVCTRPATDLPAAPASDQPPPATQAPATRAVGLRRRNVIITFHLHHHRHHHHRSHHHQRYRRRQLPLQVTHPVPLLVTSARAQLRRAAAILDDHPRTPTSRSGCAKDPC